MKKRRVLALIAMLCMLIAAVCGVAACDDGDEHTHSYGDWTITVQPTLETGGKATHKCTEDDYSEEFDIPALTDALWSKSVKTPATHASEGVDTYTSVYGSVDAPSQKLAEHTWGNWTITAKPTLEAGGKAKHTCTLNDGGEEEIDIPALSDAKVWTKDAEASTPATHTAPGTDVYKSEYGTVEVETPVTGEHSYGDWTITQNPTLEAGGKAKHTCTLGDNHEEEVDIPALSNTEVWTKDEQASTPATHAATGTDVYTSVYGSVNVTTDKLAEHTYGDWTITEEPTLTTGGKAEHTCTEHSDVKETKDIPALNDDSVWTKDEEASTPATHTAPGTDVYKSEYGTVEVEIPADSESHQWGAWSWKDGKEPTEETGATATHSCEIEGCGETEEEQVPNLKDTEVWTPGAKTEPNYNEKGSQAYTSKYGTVTVEIEKLVAPYDGKTYYSFTIDLDNVFNKVIDLKTGGSWTAAFLELDANGTGLGKAYPFKNNTKIVFKMIDAAIGKIEISFTEKADDDAEDAFTGEVTTVTGYVDMATGFVLMAANGSDFTECYLLTPYGKYTNNTATASVWGESALSYGIALSYTYTDTTEKTETLYISNSGVHFGVTFTDLAGENVAAEECYNAAQLYIKKGEETLASLGYNGTTMQELDGYEGTYTSETLGQVTLSGVGTLTASKDGAETSGTYMVTEENVLELSITGSDQITRTYSATIEGETLTATEIPVTVTFQMNGHGTQEEQKTAYKNAETELPTPADTDDYLFRGWFLEEGCTTPVSEPFKPSDDVTLYAKWVLKITVKVYPTADESVSEDLVVGEGDDVLESLQKFDTSLKDGKVFKGWKLKQDGAEDDLSNHPGLTYGAENNNTLELHAIWEVVPYIGEYYGANLDGISDSDSVSSSKTSYYLNFTEDGKVSGKFTGTVENYSNGIITAKSGNDTYYFFFDETTGLLATGSYNKATSSYITHDMALYSRTQKKFEHRAINVPNPSTSSGSQGVYARFVEAEVTVQNDGADPTTKTILVLLYDTKIYSNITVTDAFGTPITKVADIATSKTIIVTDNSTQTQILAKGSVGDNLGSGDTADLDQYYGTYTGEGDELKLDGAGTVRWGEKTGTYKAAPESSSNTFDVYILVDGEKTEYYELKVETDPKAYTATKVMVTVTFDYGDVAEPAGKLDETSYNKNIEFALPVLTDPSGAYLFRGWFSDPDFAQSLGDEEGNYAYTPEADGTTVYAKWVKKVTITLQLGDGATLPEDSLGASGTIDTLGQGEEVKILRPTKSGSKFGGWFTDSSYEHAWGEMAADGSTTVTLEVGEVIALTLYAKWEGAPAYSGEYKLFYLDGSKSGGGVDTADTYNNNIAIDAEGYAPSVSGTAYPFSGNNMQVQSYDAATGAMVFLRVGYTTTFNAFFDSAKKIIAFVNYSDDILLMIPADAGDVTVKSSYWDEGGVRVINVTVGEESYNIFVIDDTVHFDVTFEDKNGAPVAAEEAYHTPNRFYVKKDGEAIEGVKGYGYNGTTMVELDGWEGTYNYAGVPGDELDFGTIEIDGANGLTTEDEKKGTYTLVSGKDYTAELRLEGLFYYLTLTLTLNPEDNTYTVVKPMATIHYVLVDGTDVFDYEGKGDILTSTNGFPESESYNFNTEFAITQTPEVTGYVFRGWYTESGEWYASQALKQNGDGNYVYTPTEMSVTLYARFVKKVTVQVHYQKEGVADRTLEVGLGESIEPEDPGYVNGQVFKAWHLNSPDGEVWNAGTVAKEDIVLYCEWQDGVPMFGSWAGVEIYGSTDGGGTISGGSSACSIGVSADGTFSGTRSGAMTNWDPETGTFKAGSYYGAIDMKNGVMIVDYNTNTPIDNDYYIVIKKTISGSFKTSNSAACYWNGSVRGSTKLAEMTLADGSKMNIFIYEGRVWGKVTFEGTPIEGFSGELTAANVYQKAQTLVVKDSDGKVIASFIRGANGLEYSDGLQGTYSGNKGEQSQDLVLDGKGNVTWADRTGTYHAKDDAENVIEVYLDADGAQPAEYWEITLVTGDSKSYEATQPMVTLTLELYNEAGDRLLTTVTKPVNKNIPFALSETYETYVSAGWYTDQGLQTEVEFDKDGLYKPTEDATLYAKMVAKVTLTIVYGNLPDEQPSNLPNVTVDLPKGTTPDLTKYVPEPQGSYVFGGWYEDQECTATPYEGGALNESKTIYCKWIVQQYKVELEAISGSKTFEEQEGQDGVYRVGSLSNSNIAALKITFQAAGTLTFDWAADVGSDSYFVCVVNPENPKSNNTYMDGYEYRILGSKSETGNTVHVEEGDVLYFLVYDFWGSTTYAQVSNLSFVAD